MLNPVTARSVRMWFAALALMGLAGSLAGCGGGTPSTPPEAAATATAPADDADAPLPPPAFETALPEGVRAQLQKTFTGDLDEMVARRIIRVGTTFNRTFYFVDKGVQRGVVYEFGRAFEDELNKKRKTGNAKVNVVFVPLPRDLLARALTEGKVDLVLAQVTVRPELQALVDFSDSDPHQRQRGRRHRPRRPRDRLGGRPVRERRLRAHGQQVLREPGRTERAPEGEGQGARRHSRDSRQPRR